jgi:hypothetical protein
VRVLFSREDVVRLGPKRPPFAGSAVLRDGVLSVDATYAGPVQDDDADAVPYEGIGRRVKLHEVAVTGPPTSRDPRAAGWAELCALQEGALEAAEFDRAANVANDRGAAVLLDTSVRAPSGALAGARVATDDTSGVIERVEVRVAAGDPLDEVVLRSYAIGAAHMALGWVFTEGLAVDPETGEVHDLTIRSFGIVPARNVPPIDVTVVDDPGPPLARASDAVFAAVAAAAWNTVTAADGVRPETFPALSTRTARRLRA